VRTSIVFILSLALGACGGARFTTEDDNSGGSGGAGTGGASASGGAGGTSDGGAGMAGAAGANGYPELVCDVPTHQDVGTDEPRCRDSSTGCVVDWAGAFGRPGAVDGPGATARFVGLYGLAGDQRYVYASTAHAIRRISIATGDVSTLAGDGVAGYFDGNGSEARFACPKGLAERDGYLYVADSGNDRIRRIDLASGAVMTIGAGLGFNGPAHVHAGSNALLLVEPREDRVSSYHLTLETLTPFGPAAADGAMSDPHGIAFVTQWALFYLADSGNHVIRKISELAVESPQVGVMGQAGFQDGHGAEARLRSPRGMSVRQNPMTIYVADHDNHAVRRIQPLNSYAVTTMAGDGSAGHAVGVGRAAKLTRPTDVYFDPGSNSVFIAEGTVIRRVTETVE
jgi:hypothetical protein